MRTVVLIRHGEVANPNHVVYADLPGFDLSPTGVLEAHAVARHLATAPIDAVVSSPLPRAVHTASVVAARHGLPVLVDGRLRETGMYPGWTGLRWAEVADTHGEQLTRYLEDATCLDDVHEPIETIAARMRDALDDAFDVGATTFAMVGHQDPIQALRLTLCAGSLTDLRREPPPHGSATTIVCNDGIGWKEVSVWVPAVPSTPNDAGTGTLRPPERGASWTVEPS